MGRSYRSASRATITVVALVVSSTRAANARDPFSGPRSLALRAPPSDAVIADLDGDGRSEIVIAHASLASLSVLRAGSGDAAGASRIDDVGLGPLVVRAADLDGNIDGDRDVDLVVATEGGELIVLCGDGAGGFSPTWRGSAPPGTDSLLAGDFDRDGDLDLVTWSARRSVTPRVFLREPAGEYRGLAPIAASGRVEEIAATSGREADAGSLVIYESSLDGSRLVRRSLYVDGAGAIGEFARADLSLASPIAAFATFATSDAGRDGAVDAVWIDASGAVLLARADGDALVAREITRFADGEPFVEWTRAVDLDADGELELALLVDVDGLWRLRLVPLSGREGGAARDVPASLERPTGLVFGDIDGDGALDALVLRERFAALSWLRARAPGEFGEWSAWRFDVPVEKLVVGDFVEGGDELPDLMLGADWMFVAMGNDGVREFFGFATSALPRTADGGIPVAYGDLVAADIDGDGPHEIVLSVSFPVGVGGTQERYVGFAPIDREGRVIDPGPVHWFCDALLPVTIDLEQDGRDEVGVVERSLSLLTLFSVGAGGVLQSVAPSYLLPEFAYSLAAAADVDGDDRPEILLATDSSVEILSVDERGDVAPLWSLAPVGPAVRALAVGDVDGDGERDVVVAERDRVLVFVEGSDVDPLVLDPLVLDAPAAIASLAVRDVDGDGNDDIVALAGAPSALLVWTELAGAVRGDDPGARVPLAFAAGAVARAFVLEDLDGDGRLDAATVDPIAQSLVVLWGDPAQAAAARFRRGDADDDGQASLADAVRVLALLFLAGEPLACEDAGDADDSGALEINDAIFLLNYLFLGGESPPLPGPNACGPDPTSDDRLACEGVLACG